MHLISQTRWWESNPQPGGHLFLNKVQDTLIDAVVADLDRVRP